MLCQVCGAATRTQRTTRDANGNRDRFYTKCSVCGDFRWLTPEPPGWAALPAIEGPGSLGAGERIVGVVERITASESTSWAGPAASKGPTKGKGQGRYPAPAQYDLTAMDTGDFWGPPGGMAAPAEPADEPPAPVQEEETAASDALTCGRPCQGLVWMTDGSGRKTPCTATCRLAAKHRGMYCRCAAHLKAPPGMLRKTAEQAQPKPMTPAAKAKIVKAHQQLQDRQAEWAALLEEAANLGEEEFAEDPWFTDGAWTIMLTKALLAVRVQNAAAFATDFEAVSQRWREISGTTKAAARRAKTQERARVAEAKAAARLAKVDAERERAEERLRRARNRVVAADGGSSVGQPTA